LTETSLSYGGTTAIVEPVCSRSFLDMNVCVALTAYNDNEAISLAVKDFVSQENVVEVVVVDNNSHDGTARQAREAGARVVREEKQGYGHACIRGLREALSCKDAEVIVLAEGDMTFCARDIWKMIPYLDDVDMVVGSRTHTVLIDSDSQLGSFLLWGNVLLGKIMQIRFLGKTRFTDVGCTMRAIRKEALARIIDRFSVGADHFSPHMIMVALTNGLRVIEIPVNFKKRVGVSKGAGGSKKRAVKIGLKMLWHILTYRKDSPRNMKDGT
jgi:glycosyltransferase involved in cell wall biosynthesis